MEERDFGTYEDQELLNLMKLNNKGAFDEIYKRHWSSLLISAYNILKDKDACKDIVQDVFSELYIRRATICISSLTPYLKVAVRNRIFKYLKRGNLAQHHLETLEKVTFVYTTEQMINFNQLKEQYKKGLEALPDRCREVFLLSRNENLSTKEIAVRLNISPKTVENQITKALKYLRKNIIEIMSFSACFLLP
ncbi:RNA polymerase sigma-70 factor [Fulvivirgaceae bacterium BMA10]|uniref:RNA polymerase sigma-70 factor n=1 Tax=Splendidivirga corallicola TaxID=3051826 RepID=A0ABT8KXY8_9BACT|nr:RNA polymerase sigma-70 factor [Fulvivirgaceae bacterium BMA10]